MLGGMTLRVKFILLLVAFGTLMLGVMTWNHQYLLHSTMIKYVDKRDQLRLERLKNNLEVYMDEKAIFDSANISQDVWQRLLTASHRVDLTHTYIPLDILLERQYPKLLKIHPDVFERRVSLVSRDGDVIYGPQPTEGGLMECIWVDRDEAGHLAYSHRQVLTDKNDIEFAANQSFVFTAWALVISLMAVILLWPFAEHFLRPITTIAQGMRRLSQGKFSTRLPKNRNDELGQLQQDFNHLAASLEKSQQSRNQWIADISHELRTPLTVLRGRLEAIKDGVYQADGDKIHELYEEVMILNRLVEDLYQVTLNDIGGLNYKMNQVELTALVDRAIGLVAEPIRQKGLTLIKELGDEKLVLQGDEDRLQQLFVNLLVNSLTYTDADPDGQIRVQLQRRGALACLVIEDSAPGVSDQELTHLFERLYRTEVSRSRRHGGAGLGLSIVQQIVSAHGGDIQAGHSELGGIKMTVTLPL
jgi:two-component system sensor histidine kinase BaeS